MRSGTRVRLAQGPIVHFHGERRTVVDQGAVGTIAARGLGDAWVVDWDDGPTTPVHAEWIVALEGS